MWSRSSEFWLVKPRGLSDVYYPNTFRGTQLNGACWCGMFSCCGFGFSWVQSIWGCSNYSGFAVATCFVRTRYTKIVRVYTVHEQGSFLYECSWNAVWYLMVTAPETGSCV